MAAYTASEYALGALSECLAQEVKTFNVRVAIVEPGIIDTAMAQSIGTQGLPSPYSQQRRIASRSNGRTRRPNRRPRDQAERVAAFSRSARCDSSSVSISLRSSISRRA